MARQRLFTRMRKAAEYDDELWDADAEQRINENSERIKAENLLKYGKETPTTEDITGVPLHPELQPMTTPEQSYEYSKNQLDKLTDEQKADLESYTENKGAGLSASKSNALQKNEFGFLLNVLPFFKKSQEAKQELKQSDLPDTPTNIDKVLQYEEYQKYVNDYENRQRQKEELSDLNGAELEAVRGLGALVSPIGNLSAAVGAMEKPYDERLGRNINGENSALANINKDIDEIQEKNIDNLTDNKDVGSALKTLYQTKNAVLESLASMGVGAGALGAVGAGEGFLANLAGSAIGALPGGGASYANTIEEAMQRGLTEDEAEKEALVAGAIEVGTEAAGGVLGMDVFRNVGKKLTGKAANEVVKEVATSLKKKMIGEVASEAAEELAGNIAFSIADEIITGDKSKYNQAVKDYMDNGDSEEEARNKAKLDWIKETAQEMAVAGLSAGVTMGGAATVSAVATNKASKVLDGNYNNVADAISDKPEDYKTEDDYKKAMEVKEQAQTLSESDNVKTSERNKLFEDVISVNDSMKEPTLIDTINNEINSPFVEVEGSQVRKNSLTSEEVAENMSKASQNGDLNLFVEAYRDSQASDNVEARETGQQYFETLSPKFEYGNETYDNTAYDSSNVNTENVSVVQQALQERSDADIYNAILNGEDVSEQEINTPNKSAAALAAIDIVNAREDQKVQKQAQAEKTGVDTSSIHEIPTVQGTVDIEDLSIDKEGNFVETKNGKEVVIPKKNISNQAMRTFVTNALNQPTVSAKQLYIDNYSENVPIGNYNSAFNSAIIAGATNQNFDNWVDNHSYYKSVLGEDTLRIIYNEGMKTKKTEYAKKNKAMGIVNIQKGLSIDENDPFVKVLQAYAKKAKVDIDITEEGLKTDNGTARGAFQPGIEKLTIGANNNAKVQTFFHEAIGEFLQAYDQEDMKVIQDAIIEYQIETLGEKAVANKINGYVKNYKNAEYNTYREAANEFVNDSLAGLFTSKNGVEDFVNWASKEDKTILEKIKDFFNALVEKLHDIIETGGLEGASLNTAKMAEKRAKQLRTRILDAMDKVIEGETSTADVVEAKEEQQAASYSLDDAVSQLEPISNRQRNQYKNNKKILVYENIKQFDNFVERAWNNEIPGYRMIFGKANDEIVKQFKDKKGIDVSNYDVALYADNIRKSRKDHGDLNKDEVERGIDIKTSDFEELIELLISPDSVEDAVKYRESPALNFYKGNKASYVVASSGVLNIFPQTYYATKKGVVTPTRSANAQLNTPKATGKGTPSNSIISSQTDNTIGSEEKGNKIDDSTRASLNIPNIEKAGHIELDDKLSEEQKEYFADSKVVDKNGDLLPVYHGTTLDFNVFDIGQARDTEDIEGFFFSPNVEEASGYGEIGEYYLNITNPADFDTAYDLFHSFDKSKPGSRRKTREALIEMGYDGVIAYDETSPEYTEYIAFYPEQIKRSDNLEPTNSEDIRYSFNTDSEGSELTKQQKEFFNDSKIVDENGSLRVLYHQTDADFTIFDTRREGAGTSDSETPFGIFLKSSDENIGLAGERQMKLYANITNPLVAQNRADLTRQLRNKVKGYEKLERELNAIDRGYERRSDELFDATFNYMTKWVEENPNKDRQEIYEDPEYKRMSDEEDALLDEWKAEYSKRAQEIKELITSGIEAAGYDGVILQEDKGSFGRSTDAYIALRPEQVKSTENKNPTDNEDIRYSFVGENSEQYSKEIENEAVRLEKEGAEPETIYIATGMFRGADGKWRYEIDDSTANVYPRGDARLLKNNPDYRRQYELEQKILYDTISDEEFEEWKQLDKSLEGVTNKPKYLPDVLEHEELYRLYPELEDIAIQFMDLGMSTGQYSRESNKIYINEKLNLEPDRKEKIKKTLLHEVQHAIQRIEGFARGANPEEWKNEPVFANPEKREEAFQNFNNFVDSLTGDAKRLVKNIETARLINDYGMRDMYKQDLKEQFPEIAEQYDDLTAHKNIFNNTYSDFEKYRLTAGEIEARNTADRSRLNSEQRRQTMPQTTVGGTVLFAEGRDNGTPYDYVDNRYSFDVPTTYDLGESIFGNMTDEELDAVFIDDEKVAGDEYADTRKTKDAFTSIIKAANKTLEYNFTKKQVEDIADNVIKEYNSTIGREFVIDNLNGIFDAMFKYDSYDDMVNALMNLSEEIVNRSEAIDENEQSMYDSLVDALPTFNVPEEVKKEAAYKYGSWKEAQLQIKKFYNKNTTTTLDQCWSEIVNIARQNGYELDEYTPDVDQIGALIGLLDMAKPRSKQMFTGADITDVALTTAMDIMQDFYGKALEQKNADANLKELKAELKKQVNDYKKAVGKSFEEKVKAYEEEIRTLKEQQRESAELSGSLVIDKSNLEKQAKNDRELVDKYKAEAIFQNEARMQAEKMAEADRKSFARKAELQEKQKHLKSVRQQAIRLMKMIDQPTKKKFVPDVLKKPTIEMLDSFDFITYRTDKNGNLVPWGEKNGKPRPSNQKWRDSLIKMQNVLMRLENMQNEDRDDATANYMYNLAIHMGDVTSGLLDNFVKNTEDSKVAVSMLSSDKLKILDDFMKSYCASINKAQEAMINGRNVSLDQLGMKAVSEIKSLKSLGSIEGSLKKKFHDFLNIDQLEPITYFSELGGTMESVFYNIVEGTLLRNKHISETEDIMEKYKNDHGIKNKDIRTWKSDLQTFKGGLQLTIAQRMSLYASYQRAQAKHHIIFGGVMSSDERLNKRSDRKEKTRQEKPIHLTPKDVREITDTLTQEQKDFADFMVNYMSSEVSDWGNRVSQKMYGIKLFNEKHYFPIETYDKERQARVLDETSNFSLRSLQNQGFTKELQRNANNALVLSDFFSVFSNHVAKMAAYDGYVMPINDALRVFNYAEVENTFANIQNEEGKFREGESVKAQISRVLGKKGEQYFKRLIKDINEDYSDESMGTLNKLLSANKAQAVLLNGRVVIQQPTAYPRAMEVIESKYLMKALSLSPKTLWDYANKSKENSPLAWIKSKGYYETSIGQSMEAMITGSQSGKDKVNEIAGAAAGFADDITWGALYHASELKVKDSEEFKNGELKEGSEEFIDAVNKIFHEIIVKTQVIDTVLTKSQIMRSKDFGSKLFTAFMAEPTKYYNILHRGMFEYHQASYAYKQAKKTGEGLDEAKERFKKARNKFGKAMYIFLLGQFINSIAQSIYDAWRDDDDEKTSLEKFFDAWLSTGKFKDAKSPMDYVKAFFSANLIDAWWLPNLVPVAKDVSGMLQGFDAKNMSTQVISSGIGIVEEALKNESTLTPYGWAYKVAQFGSMAIGVPLANAMRETKDIYNNMNDLWGGENLTTRDNKGQYDDMKKAIDKNEDLVKVVTETKQQKVQEYLEKGETQQNAEKKAASSVKSTITSTYKPQLIELKNKDINEATAMKQKIIEAFVAAGDTRDQANKKINKWFE